ncbi:sensor histidine kinase [Paenibacillus validus]|uniref:sensor histidine kinase n=1 Tax=Paenibacillus TaxID=44249 RepID=UPI000FDC8304|nr:sensor histidine kinase [Paenibacillus validus]MED4599814.1 sensor histidine kinase [Paenibacillus validus]MED4604656.1 sensor histidine kinase [Paenibacillus validus]
MRKRTNFNTLFIKMLLIMSVSMLIPIAVLGMLSFEKSKQQIESVTSQFLQDNLALNAKLVRKIMVSVEEESRRLAASKEIQDYLETYPLANEADQVPFSVVETRLQIKLTSAYRMDVLTKNSESYSQLYPLIQAAGKKGVWIHEWDRDMSSPVFIYIALIRNSAYDTIGILTLEIPEYLVRGGLVFPSSFKNYKVMLVDSGNHIISNTDTSFYNKEYYYEEYFPTEKWKKGEVGLNRDGWKLIAAVPRDELTGTIYQIKDFTFWIVMISMIVVTLFLVILVRTFTIPIKNLVLHMNEVKRGLLNPFALYQERRDEIGQLVRGYNQMVSGMLELLHKTKAMESDKRQLELQTLNHQINPHFFYNTLDAIKWRAEHSNETTIAAMVTKLASLLRFSLNNGDEWTTVEREIEHARNYLDIELLRSNRSFQVFSQIAPDVRKKKIIKLILQPIMENAVKHGISKHPEGKGKIKLTAKRDGNEIVFIIEDNGPGYHGGPLLNLGNPAERDGTGGIGLVNVHKRLELHFGHKFGLLVHPNPNTGFRVEIRHPIIEDGQDSRSGEHGGL